MLEVTNITKHYRSPTGELRILTEVWLSLAAGDAASIVGPSGSGKSTLLYILGTLEQPSSGHIAVNGIDPFTLDDRELAVFRNTKVGFVFQDHLLLPQCTVLENVLVPTLVSDSDASVVDRAVSLLEQVGLADRMNHRPAELSGGERQRVALARALVQQPPLILCDEPTGNLDRESAEMVSSLLFQLHRQQNNVLLVVTHNAELAARCPKQYRRNKQTLESL